MPKLAGALEYFEKALKVRLAIYHENHPDVAISYYNIGSLHCNQGEYKKALECYDKALKIQLSYFDENHPDVKFIKDNIEYVKEMMKSQNQ